ncbi:hypothetical protein PCE1_004262 [Barthelona sp. PCE]
MDREDYESEFNGASLDASVVETLISSGRISALAEKLDLSVDEEDTLQALYLLLALTTSDILLCELQSTILSELLQLLASRNTEIYECVVELLMRIEPGCWSENSVMLAVRQVLNTDAPRAHLRIIKLLTANASAEMQRFGLMKDVIDCMSRRQRNEILQTSGFSFCIALVSIVESITEQLFLYLVQNQVIDIESRFGLIRRFPALKLPTKIISSLESWVLSHPSPDRVSIVLIYLYDSNNATSHFLKQIADGYSTYSAVLERVFPCLLRVIETMETSRIVSDGWISVFCHSVDQHKYNELIFGSIFLLVKILIERGDLMSHIEDNNDDICLLRDVIIDVFELHRSTPNCLIVAADVLKIVLKDVFSGEKNIFTRVFAPSLNTIVQNAFSFLTTEEPSAHSGFIAQVVGLLVEFLSSEQKNMLEEFTYDMIPKVSFSALPGFAEMFSALQRPFKIEKLYILYALLETAHGVPLYVVCTCLFLKNSMASFPTVMRSGVMGLLYKELRETCDVSSAMDLFSLFISACEENHAHMLSHGEEISILEFLLMEIFVVDFSKIAVVLLTKLLNADSSNAFVRAGFVTVFQMHIINIDDSISESVQLGAMLCLTTIYATHEFSFESDFLNSVGTMCCRWFDTASAAIATFGMLFALYVDTDLEIAKPDDIVRKAIKLIEVNGNENFMIETLFGVIELLAQKQTLIFDERVLIAVNEVIASKTSFKGVINCALSAAKAYLINVADVWPEENDSLISVVNDLFKAINVLIQSSTIRLSAAIIANVLFVTEQLFQFCFPYLHRIDHVHMLFDHLSKLAVIHRNRHPIVASALTIVYLSLTNYTMFKKMMGSECDIQRICAIPFETCAKLDHTVITDLRHLNQKDYLQSLLHHERLVRKQRKEEILRKAIRDRVLYEEDNKKYIKRKRRRKHRERERRSDFEKAYDVTKKMFAFTEKIRFTELREERKARVALFDLSYRVLLLSSFSSARYNSIKEHNLHGSSIVTLLSELSDIPAGVEDTDVICVVLDLITLSIVLSEDPKEYIKFKSEMDAELFFEELLRFMPVVPDRVCITIAACLLSSEMRKLLLRMDVFEIFNETLMRHRSNHHLRLAMINIVSLLSLQTIGKDLLKDRNLESIFAELSFNLIRTCKRRHSMLLLILATIYHLTFANGRILEELHAEDLLTAMQYLRKKYKEVTDPSLGVLVSKVIVRMSYSSSISPALLKYADKPLSLLKDSCSAYNVEMGMNFVHNIVIHNPVLGFRLVLLGANALIRNSMNTFSIDHDITELGKYVLHLLAPSVFQYEEFKKKNPSVHRQKLIQLAIRADKKRKEQIEDLKAQKDACETGITQKHHVTFNEIVDEFKAFQEQSEMKRMLKEKVTESEPEIEAGEEPASEDEVADNEDEEPSTPIQENLPIPFYDLALLSPIKIDDDVMARLVEEAEHEFPPPVFTDDEDVEGKSVEQLEAEVIELNENFI